MLLTANAELSTSPTPPQATIKPHTCVRTSRKHLPRDLLVQHATNARRPAARVNGVVGRSRGLPAKNDTLLCFTLYYGARGSTGESRHLHTAARQTNEIQ